MKTNEIPFSPGDHVIAYLRDSGHENQEASIQQQENELLNFCEKNKLILDMSFKDEALQGSSDEARVKLAEMMNDLRHGLNVAGVLVWSSSRFARNSIHAQFYRAEIRKLGYRFYSITGQNVDGPEAIIFEALDDYKNERFLADLSIDVKRGLRSLVRDHGCVPGDAPTGFKREPVMIGVHRDGKQRIGHKWVPDELTAPRVKQAFEMRASGYSLGDINTETKLFRTVNSYRTFFCNKIYFGELHFGDELIIPNYCPALVEKDTWDAVQIIQNNYTRHKNMNSSSAFHPRRVASKYLLSGLIHCARCGSPLFGRSHPQKNGSINTSYYCTQAYNQRNCTKHRIPGKTIELTVLKLIKENYLSPETLADAKYQIQKVNEGKKEQFIIQRRQLAAELAEVRRQLTNLAKAIAKTGHTDTILKLLNDLEINQSDYVKKIGELDANAKNEIPDIPLENVKQLVHLFEIKWEKADIKGKRHILSGMISRIDVDRDGRKIFGMVEVNYPPQIDISVIEDDFGEYYVRRTSVASGPPRYTHIIEFNFSIMGKSGGYKQKSVSN